MVEEKTVLPQVKVSMEIREIVEELRFVTIRGKKVEVSAQVDIVREALAKGLKLMLLEKQITEQLLEEEAIDSAIRRTSQITNEERKTVLKRLKRMEEEEEHEEEEEEEEGD